MFVNSIEELQVLLLQHRSRGVCVGVGKPLVSMLSGELAANPYPAEASINGIIRYAEADPWSRSG